MDSTRFDRIAKAFADRKLSRRQALAQGGMGLAAAGLATAGFRAAAAQDATPAADAGPVPGLDSKVAMLFLQSFQGGSIAAIEGQAGRYTLTLEQGLGQTIYFSDRPDRIVGVSPTDEFLDALGFEDDNPPNAALVAEIGPGETDIAVVELFNPTYDTSTNTATYEIEVLDNWQDALETGFTEAPTDLGAVAPTFGAAQLFIDDCPDKGVACQHWNGETGFQPQDGSRFLGTRGSCYSFPWSCNPCDQEALDRECAASFPDFCNAETFCKASMA